MPPVATQELTSAYAQPTTPPDPPAVVDQVAQLCDDICEVHPELDREYVERFICMMQELGNLIDITTGEPVALGVDMHVHDVLEAVVPDESIAVPGSLHDQVNQVCLAPGWQVRHTKAEHCVVVAEPSVN